MAPAKPEMNTILRWLRALYKSGFLWSDFIIN